MFTKFLKDATINVFYMNHVQRCLHGPVNKSVVYKNNKIRGVIFNRLVRRKRFGVLLKTFPCESH